MKKGLPLLLAALVTLTLSAPEAVWASGGGGGGAKKESQDKKARRKDVATITGGADATSNEPVFLHLTPVTFPIINDYGAQQIISMLIDLQMKDLESARELQRNMPRLKDALMVALYGGLADGKMRNAEALDIPAIKNNIQKTLDQTFGAGLVQNVYIQGVSQRKL